MVLDVGDQDKMQRAMLWFVAAVFTVLAAQLLIVPADALSKHGIGIYGQPPSAFAEIRAHHAGTLATLAIHFARSAHGTDPATVADGLRTLFAVLGLFVLVRCFSFVVDGPPTIAYDYAMWGGEVMGAAAAAVLYRSSASNRAATTPAYTPAAARYCFRNGRRPTAAELADASAAEFSEAKKEK